LRTKFGAEAVGGVLSTVVVPVSVLLIVFVSAFVLCIGVAQADNIKTKIKSLFFIV